MVEENNNNKKKYALPDWYGRPFLELPQLVCRVRTHFVILVLSSGK